MLKKGEKNGTIKKCSIKTSKGRKKKVEDKNSSKVQRQH